MIIGEASLNLLVAYTDGDQEDMKVVSWKVKGSDTIDQVKALLFPAIAADYDDFGDGLEGLETNQLSLYCNEQVWENGHTVSEYLVNNGDMVVASTGVIGVDTDMVKVVLFHDKRGMRGNTDSDDDLPESDDEL